MDEERTAKEHKPRVSGNKAAKKELKQKKKKGIDTQPNRGSNPKAFVGNAPTSRKARQQVRSTEKRENALTTPQMDKSLASVYDEPPLLVAVVGPPGVGKTTLIRSMIKFYTHKNIHNLRGPITSVAGKYRRCTFIECPNTLSAMIDVAKIAELVVLMIDGNFGFEMETFEFLNIAQVHGFPKVVGVVSHLDKMKSGKQLKKAKKLMRHRFWHEVAAGAKMVCLAPMIHGVYRPSDVLKLHRYIITTKVQLQSWRNAHACLLVDRMEDVTDVAEAAMKAEEDDSKEVQQQGSMNEGGTQHTKSVAFYGYVRGHPIKANTRVAIPGLGDFNISHITRQDDPCTAPNRSTEGSGNSKMRSLNDKQRKVYAPFSDVGDVFVDEEGVFIRRDAEKDAIERGGAGFQLMRELQEVGETIDGRLKASAIDVVGGATRRPMMFANDESLEMDVKVENAAEAVRRSKAGGKRKATGGGALGSSDDDDDYDSPDEEVGGAFGAAGNDEDDDNNDDGLDEDEEALLRQFGPSGAKRRREEDGASSVEGAVNEFDDDDDGGFVLAPRDAHELDSTRISTMRRGADFWKAQDDCERIRHLFVTGSWTPKESLGVGGSGPVQSKEGQEEEANDEDDVYGDKGYESVSGGDDDLDRDDDDGYLPRQRRSGPAAPSSPLDDGMSIDSDDDEGDGDIVLDDDLDDDDDDDGGEDEEAVVHDEETAGMLERFIAFDQQKKTGASAPTMGAMSSGVDLLGLGDDGDDGEADTFGEDGAGSGSDADDGSDDGLLPGEKKKKKKPDGGDGDPEDYMKKKIEKKKLFDQEYDESGTKNKTTAYFHHLQQEKEEKEEHLKRTLDDFGDDIDQKIALAGFFAGLYVRIVIHGVPVEFLKQYNPVNPVIIGSVKQSEEENCIVQLKMKRHRWYPRILKANDPVFMSIGWRRVQSVPIFATEDANSRLRYLKYSPQHMHCVGAIYAPGAPPNTGVLFYPADNASGEQVKNFRITATGFVTAASNSCPIVKKLKVTGVPQRIEKTTAFIKGMFTSDLEAAKFVGAKIKAVSGLRGIIKKVMKGKRGLVRATFEDKLLMSDIVFMRSWIPVAPTRFCVNIPSHINPQWSGLRKMRELRQAYNVPLGGNADSEYKPIKRRRGLKEGTKVLLSRTLRQELPFSLKEDYIPLRPTSKQKLQIEAERTDVTEPHEVRQRAMVEMLRKKAEKMDEKKKETKRAARNLERKKTKKDEEKLKGALKKAKKETARKLEFRAQRKSKK